MHVGFLASCGIERDADRVCDASREQPEQARGVDAGDERLDADDDHPAHDNVQGHADALHGFGTHIPDVQADAYGRDCPLQDQDNQAEGRVVECQQAEGGVAPRDEHEDGAVVEDAHDPFGAAGVGEVVRRAERIEHDKRDTVDEGCGDACSRMVGYGLDQADHECGNAQRRPQDMGPGVQLLFQARVFRVCGWRRFKFLGGFAGIGRKSLDALGVCREGNLL